MSHSRVRRVVSAGALASILVAVAALVAGCSDSNSDEPPADGSIAGTVTVFAAASLTDSFEEIATRFETAYPGVEVEFNFAGTPTLRTQLEQGARADVFASANPQQMELAVASGVVEAGPQVFARNSLVVIRPADNPADITTLSDLAEPGLKLIFANPEVPVGAYTVNVLESLASDSVYGEEFDDAVLGNVVSLESNVKQVVAKVELGEADAGIVYGTDVTPGLAVIEIPEQHNVIAEYPVAVVEDAANQAGAEAFIAFLLSDEGQDILGQYNFLGLALAGR